jgi:hypothetical protein
MEYRIDKRFLKRLLVKATGGCNIQHTGWPCNTCFHVLDLPLKHNIHDYWLAVLAFRGDYPDLPQCPNLIKELYEVLCKEGTIKSI